METKYNIKSVFITAAGIFFAGGLAKKLFSSNKKSGEEFQNIEYGRDSGPIIPYESEGEEDSVSYKPLGSQ